jgi:hypothetical protein
MTCGATEFSKARVLHNVPVWRYHFANIKPGQSKGAGTDDDVAQVFGDGVSTFSKLFQSAFAGFIRDPQNGLSRLGWPRYDAQGKQWSAIDSHAQCLIELGNTLVRVGQDGVTSVDFPNAHTYDEFCQLQL